jgi:hypothetical protein
MAKQNRRITVWDIHSYSLDLKVLVTESQILWEHDLPQKLWVRMSQETVMPPSPGSLYNINQYYKTELWNITNQVLLGDLRMD